jgi:membrane protein DedA with SNARE-associated domain
MENTVLHQLIDPILTMIKDAVAQGGYLAVIIMMAIESANIPLPSEAIMPTAGLLVQEGKMNIHLAALAGAVGCVVGSIPSYFLGMFGGRPFLAKYGRYFLATSLSSFAECCLWCALSYHFRQECSKRTSPCLCSTPSSAL